MKKLKNFENGLYYMQTYTFLNKDIEQDNVLCDKALNLIVIVNNQKNYVKEYLTGYKIPIYYIKYYDGILNKQSKIPFYCSDNNEIFPFFVKIQANYYDEYFWHCKSVDFLGEFIDIYEEIKRQEILNKYKWRHNDINRFIKELDSFKKKGVEYIEQMKILKDDISIESKTKVLYKK